MGSLSLLELLLLGCAGVLIVVFTLKDWRKGLVVLLIWLVFEDLPRKFSGNNMWLFFAKIVLAAVVWVAFLQSRARAQLKTFHQPFHLPLFCFFLWAVVEVFNPNSPSVFYGLLGLLLYFFFAPLMFLSYSLLRSEADLDVLLKWIQAAALVVAALGVIQAVVGHSFLNPDQLAPEISELGSLVRVAPISRETVIRPTGVFVSDGRFSSYMTLILILSLASTIYTFLRKLPWRVLPLATAVTTGLAVFMSGSRGAFVYGGGGFLLLIGSLLAHLLPSRLRLAGRMRLLLARFIVSGLAVAAVTFIFFPGAAASRWIFYQETLSPDSPASELGGRTWYTIGGFIKAFEYPEWAIGYGTGTASLGGQYVASRLNVAGGESVENGYGSLVLEFGIIGPLLWVAWAAPLVISGWKAVQRLRGTPLFPIGFSIVWFAFLLLFPITFGTNTVYQNYVINAYFWLLVGIMFRLPDLAEAKYRKQPANALVAVYAA